jgi:hypothetical protein
MDKEVGIFYFEVTFQHLIKVNEGNHKKSVRPRWFARLSGGIKSWFYIQYVCVRTRAHTHTHTHTHIYIYIYTHCILSTYCIGYSPMQSVNYTLEQ